MREEYAMAYGFGKMEGLEQEAGTECLQERNEGRLDTEEARYIWWYLQANMSS